MKMHVTNSSNRMLPLDSTFFHAAMDSGGVRRPRGNVTNTAIDAATHAMAKMKYTVDQLVCAPIKLASGIPTADASDQPRNTKATAPARRSGAMNKPIAL